MAGCFQIAPVCVLLLIFPLLSIVCKAELQSKSHVHNKTSANELSVQNIRIAFHEIDNKIKGWLSHKREFELEAKPNVMNVTNVNVTGTNGNKTRSRLPTDKMPFNQSQLLDEEELETELKGMSSNGDGSGNNSMQGHKQNINSGEELERQLTNEQIQRPQLSVEELEEKLNNMIDKDVKAVLANITIPTRNLTRDSRGIKDKISQMKNKWSKNSRKKKKWSLSREEASEVFNKYYECITKALQQAHDEERGMVKPMKAVMLLEGERVTINCTVCSRPDQDRQSQRAVWQHIRRSDSDLNPSLEGSGVKISKQGSLTIKAVQLDDAGQYTCLDTERQYMAIYQLDVVIKERRKMIKEGEPLLDDTVIEDHNLKLLTTWAAWGRCDTCGEIGTQQRLGTCVVKKVNLSLPVMPRDFPMIELYPGGVPCFSTALPYGIRRLKEVRRRHEETLVKECNVSCPTTAPPVIVTDSDGKQLEVIPSGTYYELNEKPVIPPMVKRRILYEPEKKHLIMTCSDVERGAGVRWMRGKRRIDPMSIKRQTDGRVWTDSANRLHIGVLLLSDTNVYSCWVGQVHVVAIKVLVTDSFNDTLKDYITYSGFAAVIFIGLVTFVVLACRKRNKVKS